MKAIIVGFGLIITIRAACALVSGREPEPQCYSRFDYEYKVVEKLFELENGAKEQQTLNKAWEIELETIKSVIEQRVGALEKNNAQLNIDIEDMKIENEGLKSEVETMKAQLLELKGKHWTLSLSILLKMPAWAKYKNACIRDLVNWL